MHVAAGISVVLHVVVAKNGGWLVMRWIVRARVPEFVSVIVFCCDWPEATLPKLSGDAAPVMVSAPEP